MCWLAFTEATSNDGAAAVDCAAAAEAEKARHARRASVRMALSLRARVPIGKWRRRAAKSLPGFAGKADCRNEVRAGSARLLQQTHRQIPALHPLARKSHLAHSLERR